MNFVEGPSAVRARHVGDSVAFLQRVLVAGVSQQTNERDCQNCRGDLLKSLLHFSLLFEVASLNEIHKTSLLIVCFDERFLPFGTFICAEFPAYSQINLLFLRICRSATYQTEV